MSTIKLLADMIESGVNNLYNNYPHIDKLNVFPVPDGDTGTNMNLTLTNGLKEIKDVKFNTIGELLNTFSRGLIMGARGNSGVIFSQIIKGLAKGMNDSEFLSVADWKKGFNEATVISYKAVMKPVEGTILTVIREISEMTDKLDDNLDFVEFWKKVIQKSNVSLENTPNLLKALKDVGVVDSGAYGLVKFLEGMYSVVKDGAIIQKLAQLEKNEGGNLELETDDELGYCTEAIVILNYEWINKLQTKVINEQLTIYGNASIVVVIDEEILKVHTHALSPGQALSFLQQYGDFQTVKIENMSLQADKQVKNRNEKWKETSNIKIVRSLKNKMATITVVPSDALKQHFENDLGIDLAINGGDKMNPSTNDFLKAIEQVDAENIFIMPNNSNVYLTAKQAAIEETVSKVYVIPTKTVQQGMSSALSFDPSTTASKNNTTLSRAIKNITSISITKAAKEANIDGILIKKDQQFVIVDGKITGAAANIKTLFEKYVAKYITNRSEIITVFVGEDASPAEIANLRKWLDENFNVEYEIIEGGQKIYSFLIGIE